LVASDIVAIAIFATASVVVSAPGNRFWILATIVWAAFLVIALRARYVRRTSTDVR